MRRADLDQLADEVLADSRQRTGGHCAKARPLQWCCSYHEGMSAGLDLLVGRLTGAEP